MRKKLVIAEKVAEYINLVNNNPNRGQEVLCQRMMQLRNELVLMVDDEVWKLVMRAVAAEKQLDVWHVLIELRTRLGIAEGDLINAEPIYHQCQPQQ